ncbi:FUSC family protein [Romboutsia sp.]|uniref:FUSC family protein n=1 Tax=Romboutsia sp. TaxID=1965302 RepID=UPI003F3D19A5
MILSIHMKHIGMRTTKTGIGIFLSIFLSPLIVQTPLYAAIACMMSIQTSVKGSIVTGLTRIKGTILGGIIGYLFTAFLMPNNALICALGAVCTIYLCILLKMKEEVAIATVTFLSINLGTIESALIYHSIHRVIDNSVGVFIGICVNYFLARPNHAKDVIKTLEAISLDIDKFLNYKILKKKKVNFDIENLESLISTLEKTHTNYVISTDYENIEDNINVEEDENSIKNLIILCRELYFHIQSIMHLERKLFLSNFNYRNLKELYPGDNINWELDDVKSPVFNYHLSKILSRHSQLNTTLVKIGIEIDNDKPEE